MKIHRAFPQVNAVRKTATSDSIVYQACFRLASGKTARMRTAEDREGKEFGCSTLSSCSQRRRDLAIRNLPDPVEK
jgi:hypothetical protein